MCVLLEVVPTSVGHDPAVDDVYLSDRPDVEARFGEQFLEKRVLADLNVAGPKPQPLHQSAVRKRAFVFVMKDPGDRGLFAVHAGHVDDVQPLERDRPLVVDGEFVSMRTKYLRFNAFNVKFNIAQPDRISQGFGDLIAELELRREGNRSY